MRKNSSDSDLQSLSKKSNSEIKYDEWQTHLIAQAWCQQHQIKHTPLNKAARYSFIPLLLITTYALAGWFSIYFEQWYTERLDSHNGLHNLLRGGLDHVSSFILSALIVASDSGLTRFALHAFGCCFKSCCQSARELNRYMREQKKIQIAKDWHRLHQKTCVEKTSIAAKSRELSGVTKASDAKAIEDNEFNHLLPKVWEKIGNILVGFFVEKGIKGMAYLFLYVFTDNRDLVVKWNKTAAPVIALVYAAAMLTLHNYHFCRPLAECVTRTYIKRRRWKGRCITSCSQLCVQQSGLGNDEEVGLELSLKYRDEVGAGVTMLLETEEDQKMFIV